MTIWISLSSPWLLALLLSCRLLSHHPSYSTSQISLHLYPVITHSKTHSQKGFIFRLPQGSMLRSASIILFYFNAIAAYLSSFSSGPFILCSVYISNSTQFSFISTRVLRMGAVVLTWSLVRHSVRTNQESICILESVNKKKVREKNWTETYVLRNEWKFRVWEIKKFEVAKRRLTSSLAIGRKGGGWEEQLSVNLTTRWRN